MPLTIWLLTSQSATGERGPWFMTQALKGTTHENSLSILGLDEIYGKYKGSVDGLNFPYDLWRWSVLAACLRQAREQDDLPDLLDHGTTTTIALSLEYLVDLTKIALSQQVNINSKFMNRAVLSCRPEPGQPNATRFFALPFTVDCRVLFYNKTFFSEGNFQNWTTFAGLRASKPWFGLLTGLDALHDLLPILWSMGADILRAIDLRPMIRSSTTVDALVRIAELAAGGAIPLGAQDRILHLDQAKQALVTGEVQVATASYYLYQLLDREKKTAQFGATLPPGDWCRASFVGGSNLGIVNKHGDNILNQDYEPARGLLEFLCADVRMDHIPFSLPQQTAAWKYNVSVGKLPPQLPLWEEMQREYGRDRTDPFTNALLVSPPQLRLPSIYQMGFIEDVLKNAFRDFWDDVAFVIEAAATQADAKNEMKGVVRKHVESIHENLCWLLEGLVTVRYRPVGASDPSFVYGGLKPLSPLTGDTSIFQGIMPRYLVLPPIDDHEHYSLIVDENRRQCRVYVAPKAVSARGDWKTIPFADLDSEALNLLLSVIRSEQGRIRVPRPSRRELEDLEQLVHFEWVSTRAVELLETLGLDDRNCLNPTDLFNELKDCRRNPALSRHLFDQLPPSLQQLPSTSRGPSTPTPVQFKQMLAAINQRLARSCLDTSDAAAARFGHVNLSVRSRWLTSQSLVGNDCIRLNHALLEQVYPDLLVPLELEWDELRPSIHAMYDWLDPQARRAQAREYQRAVHKIMSKDQNLTAFVHALVPQLSTPISERPNDPYAWPVVGKQRDDLVNLSKAVGPILEQARRTLIEAIHSKAQNVLQRDIIGHQLKTLRRKLGVAIIPKDSPGKPREFIMIPPGIGIYHIAPVALPETECPVCGNPA